MSRKRLLNNEQVTQIGDAFEEKGATALAKEYGVSRQTVYRAVDEFARAGQGNEKTATATPAVPFGEYGVTGLARFGGTVREDYNRTWQDLGTMVPLVKEMLDHPIVSSAMFAVEMYIRTAEWSVVPGGDEAADEEARIFLEECMNDMSHTFADHITQALSMLHYGFAPFEVCYKKRQGSGGKHSSEYDDGRIGWRKFAFRSQDTLSSGHEWEFDDNGGIKGMYQKAEWRKPEVFIPIEKMILYRTTAAKNNPQGRSALRGAYMAWYYAKNFAEIEGISAERMGGGLPVIYLGEGTNKAGSKSDFDFAKQVVRDVRSDEQAGIVFPFQKQGQDGRGVLFELVSPPAKGVVDFNRAIMRYNQQISQTLLAQFIFLGLTEYGTQSLAIELTDLFAEAMNGWISVVTDVLNRYIVPRLFAFNTFTVQHLPQFYAAPTQDIDVEAVMNAVTLAVGSGVLLPDEGTERLVRKMLEMPQRSDPDAGRLLSLIPEYQEAAAAKAGGTEGDAESGVVKPDEEARLASMKVRRHKPVRNPATKVQQRVGSGAAVGSKKTSMEDDTDVIETFEEVKVGIIDEFKLALEIVTEKVNAMEPAEPVEIHVHNSIDAHLPEQDAPKVDIHVDARQTEQPAPRVDVHVDAPQIDVHVPEQEQPQIDVHVAAPSVKNVLPANPVNLDITVQAPDEIIETETVVNRDKESLIDKVRKISRRRGKK